MKTYEGKTLDDVIQHACQDLGITPDELTYEIIEEKKGLFSKKVVIECYCESMVQEYMESFVRKTLTNMEFQVETVSYVQDGRIYCNINTDNNSILIGKGGKSLQSFNRLVKAAVSAEFKKRVGLLIDVNGYKEDRYEKICKMAVRVAKDVRRTKVDATLDPMPADERKAIHNALAKMADISTKSEGEGEGRRLRILYTPGKEIE